MARQWATKTIGTILMAPKMAAVRGVGLREGGKRPIVSLGEKVGQLELIDRSRHEECGALREKEIPSHEALQERVWEFAPFAMMMRIAAIRLLSRFMKYFGCIGMKQRTLCVFASKISIETPQEISEQ
jgi:hypothetical protein